MVDSLVLRYRADVQEHADSGLEDWRKRVEGPPVGVEFLLILLLEAEDYLHWDNARRQLLFQLTFGC